MGMINEHCMGSICAEALDLQARRWFHVFFYIPVGEHRLEYKQRESCQGSLIEPVKSHWRWINASCLVAFRVLDRLDTWFLCPVIQKFASWSS